MKLRERRTRVDPKPAPNCRLDPFEFDPELIGRVNHEDILTREYLRHGRLHDVESPGPLGKA